MKTHKTCKECELKLPVSKFSTCRTTRDGFYPICKTCSAAKHRYLRALEKTTVFERQWNITQRQALAYMRGSL